MKNNRPTVAYEAIERLQSYISAVNIIRDGGRPIKRDMRAHPGRRVQSVTTSAGSLAKLRLSMSYSDSRTSASIRSHVNFLVSLCGRTLIDPHCQSPTLHPALDMYQQCALNLHPGCGLQLAVQDQL